MKAFTLNGYEGLSSLRFAEVATPEPGPNDLLVKVKAASVNPVDTKIARGYGGPSQRPLPHVLGRDGAGTVTKVFSLLISSNTPGPLVITTSGTQGYTTLGAGVSVPLFASGGTGAYSWSIQSGGLPPGVTLQGPGRSPGCQTFELNTSTCTSQLPPLATDAAIGATIRAEDPEGPTDVWPAVGGLPAGVCANERGGGAVSFWGHVRTAGLSGPAGTDGISGLRGDARGGRKQAATVKS